MTPPLLCAWFCCGLAKAARAKSGFLNVIIFPCGHVCSSRFDGARPYNFGFRAQALKGFGAEVLGL